MKYPEALDFSATSIGWTVFYRGLPVANSGQAARRPSPRSRDHIAGMYRSQAATVMQALAAGAGAPSAREEIERIDAELAEPTTTTKE